MKLSNLISYALLQVILTGCAKSIDDETPLNPKPQPLANFTYSYLDSVGRSYVKFTNTSTNAVSYKWSFGNSGSSTEINPIYAFDCAGNNTVKLIAYGNSNYPNYSIHSDTIYSKTKPVIKITKIIILDMRFVDTYGRYWDNKYPDEDQGRPEEDGTTWPDIYFNIHNLCWNLTGDSIINNVHPLELPVAFEIDSGQIELTERQPTLEISIYDRDDRGVNFIGSISLLVYPLINAKIFPTYVEYTHSGYGITVGLNLNWL